MSNRTRYYRAACIALIAGRYAADDQRAIDWARIGLGLDPLPDSLPQGIDSLDSYRATYEKLADAP